MRGLSLTSGLAALGTIALGTIALGTMAVGANAPDPARATQSGMASGGSASGVNNQAIMDDRLPRALSEFGFFADAAAQLPAQGVIPYRLNTPLYSDDADKLRFIYVPDGQQLGAAGEGLLDFPIGTALIKTFAYGQGATRRLIETRVMLHRADGWIALPYRWDEDQQDAKLALAGGRLMINTAQFGEISYRIPNKNQCKECHGLNGDVIPLGPKARNLSREWLAQMVADERLDLMPDGHDIMPLWEARDNADIDRAARAYLDVNCAHCHRPGATASNSGLDLRWEQENPAAIGIYKRPVAAGRGAGGMEFSIVPGDPDRSILLYRLNSTEPGIAMPELGKATIDAEGMDIVRRWIAEMK